MIDPQWKGKYAETRGSSEYLVLHREAGAVSPPALHGGADARTRGRSTVERTRQLPGKSHQRADKAGCSTVERVPRPASAPPWSRKAGGPCGASSIPGADTSAPRWSTPKRR